MPVKRQETDSGGARQLTVLPRRPCGPGPAPGRGQGIREIKRSLKRDVARQLFRQIPFPLGLKGHRSVTVLGFTVMTWAFRERERRIGRS